MARCGAPFGSLSAAERNRLPASSFGLPETRQYPMPDSSHAKNAKARAEQQLRAGNLSATDYARVVRKANRIIENCEGTVAKKRRKKTAKRKTKKKATRRKKTTKRKTTKRKKTAKRKTTKKKAKRKTTKRKKTAKRKTTKRKKTAKRKRTKKAAAPTKPKRSVNAALKAAVGPKL